MIRRFLVFIAISYLHLVAPVGTGQGRALASEQGAGSRLDATYTRLMTEERWEAAYDYLKGSLDAQDRLMIAHHLHMGVGTPQDVCAAVRILEDLWNPDSVLATSALELVYGSGWPAIASQEGSGPASYALGTYFMNNSNRRFSKLLGKEFFFIDKAYVNFRRSAYFGFEPAKDVLIRLESDFPHLKNVAVGYGTKKILCGRR